jgi:glycerophosphoryl diester phosphodiesterase
MKPLFLICSFLGLTSFSLIAQPDLNYRVDTLDKGFWRIQAVKGTLSTVYLIEGTREALVIDACSGQQDLQEIVQQLIGNKPVKLALTHGHFDHSGGMKFFPEVYVHKADTFLLPKGSNSVLHFIDEGDVFDLGGQRIEVIAIPGHTPGSVVFFNRNARYLLTGDGIGSSMVWMQISSLPLTVYLASVKKLEAMRNDIDSLYVGHHEREAVRLTPQYITDMRIVTEKVLSGNIETSGYKMGNRSGRQAVYNSATLVYNPARLGKTEFVAHRGESGIAPENTLAAFCLAWESNADAAELDIHLSKDNRIMVIHDENTKRTSGQDYEVKNTSSDILRTLDVGKFKDNSYLGEKIPFLEEVIQTIPPGKKLVIEIKSGADVLPGLVKMVQESGKKDQLVFIAFGWDVILETKRLFPENRCYWLSSNKQEILSKMGDAAKSGLDGLDLHFLAIDEALMTKARELDLEVMAWTVDNPKEASRLISLGVTAITTNRTAWMRSQIRN